MEITDLTIKIILLLIPGYISTLIIDQLTIHRPWSVFKNIGFSIVLGVISYALLQGISKLLYAIFKSPPNTSISEFWEKISDSNIPGNVILLATLISIVLGLILSFLIQKKVLHNLAYWMKLTDKYGEECLFYFHLNSIDINEVYIRDLESNLTYHGFIDSFSESQTEREIVLKDVDVFKFDETEPIYSLKNLFLSKNKDKSWIIETPYNKTDEKSAK